MLYSRTKKRNVLNWRLKVDRGYVMLLRKSGRTLEAEKKCKGHE